MIPTLTTYIAERDQLARDIQTQALRLEESRAVYDYLCLRIKELEDVEDKETTTPNTVSADGSLK